MAGGNIRLHDMQIAGFSVRIASGDSMCRRSEACELPSISRIAGPYFKRRDMFIGGNYVLWLPTANL